MISVKTFIYKRAHRSKNVSWMVRWKELETGAWRTATGGRTKDEAQIVEMRVRQALLRGESPDTKIKISDRPDGQISRLIDEFYTSPRFLSLSMEWRKAVRSQMERVIRPHFGMNSIQNIKKDFVYKIYFSLKEMGLSHSIIKKYHYKLTVLGEYFSGYSSGSM